MEPYTTTNKNKWLIDVFSNNSVECVGILASGWCWVIPYGENGSVDLTTTTECANNLSISWLFQLTHTHIDMGLGRYHLKNAN